MGASSSVRLAGEGEKNAARKRGPSGTLTLTPAKNTSGTFTLKPATGSRGKASAFTWGCALSSRPKVVESRQDAPCQQGDQTKPATEVAPAKELDLDSDDGKEWQATQEASKQADGASLENDGDPDFLSLQEDLFKRLGSSSSGAVNLENSC